MTRLAPTLALLLIALPLAACGGSSQPTPAQPTAKAGPPPADDPSCPVTVPGTSVTTEDTATGAALVFVTTGDVAELRKRVVTLAAMHNERHGAMGPLPTGDEAGGGHDHHAGHAGHAVGSAAGGGHEGHGAGGDHAGHAGGMISVHSKAASEDIDSGAKLVIVVGGADVAKLQTELRKHAEHLASGTCKMDHH